VCDGGEATGADRRVVTFAAGMGRGNGASQARCSPGWSLEEGADEVDRGE